VGKIGGHFLLKKFQKLTIGRELKMVELKEEIKKLKKELEKYQTG